MTRTRLTVLLAGVSMLLATTTVFGGTADNPEVSDDASDSAILDSVPCGDLACAGPTGFIDLAAGWIHAETETSIELRMLVHGNNNANAYGSADFEFHFTIDGTEYIAGFNSAQSFVAAGGEVTPTGVSSAAAYVDDQMSVTVPRASIGDPQMGTSLLDTFVTSVLQVGGAVPNSFTDRAPDSGTGTSYTFQAGGGAGGDPDDTDADGLPDAWENEHFGNLDQSNEDDPDMDGLTNAGEYAQGTDPNNPDTDGDGWSDGDEALVYGTDPNDPDSFPPASNEADSDADGLDDQWETDNFGDLNQTGTDDPDGDGCDNLCEQAADTDPNDADSFPSTGTGGNDNDDSDSDGLNDTWEIQHFGNLSQTGTDDPDGDGCDNLCEQGAGTDPNDAESLPVDSGGDLDIRKELEDDQDYLIYSAIGLVACSTLIILALAVRWA